MPEAPRAADRRPDPDALIALAAAEHRGRLKIFLGAAPGVGKTWEMLVPAKRQPPPGPGAGRCLAGVVETHGRAGTIAEAEGLPELPLRAVPYRGQILREFDLDGALARRPALLLVDELAHTNAPGSRHAKRWEDVAECVQAGLTVWATLNVQHLESLNDERGPDHWRAGDRDAARPGAGDGRRDRADRPAARGAAHPAAGGADLPRRQCAAGAGRVFQGGQSRVIAGDGVAPGGGPCGRGRAELDGPQRGHRAVAVQRAGAGAGGRGRFGGGGGPAGQAAWRRRCMRPGRCCMSSATRP